MDKTRRSKKDTNQRLQKILQGAFSGPPTPLKDIPIRTGESRAVRSAVASAASAKTAKRRSGNPA
jgi:hypothetical protein